MKITYLIKIEKEKAIWGGDFELNLTINHPLGKTKKKTNGNGWVWEGEERESQTSYYLNVLIFYHFEEDSYVNFINKSLLIINVFF